MKSTTPANKTFLGANVPRCLDRTSVPRILSRHSSLSVSLILVSLQFVLAIAECGSLKGVSSMSYGGPIPIPTPPSTTVSVSPHTALLQVNGQQQFTASASGTNNTAVNWTASGGAVPSSGMYTAPDSAGTFTVTPTSQADGSKSDFATVTVSTDPPPSRISVTITPGTVSLQTGATKQFTATVTGSANTAVTWTASGGSITSGGLYTAPGSAGTFTVTATSVADATKKGSATANVSVAGTWPVGWNEIPGTHLRDHTPSGCSDGFNFNSNAEFIMGQWSGGVADTTNNRLLIFGGGHGNGFDNGVYALNVGSDAAHTNMSQLVTSTCLTNWGSRSTSPAENGLNINGSGPCSTYSSACNPNARQTYDALVYDPVHNKMIDFGGVPAWNNGNWTDFIWELDLNTLRWTRVGQYQQSNIVGMIASGWDPNTNTAWVYDEQNLNQYDPATHTARLVRQTGTGDYHQTSIIDPVNNVFWSMGNGVMQYLSLPNGSFSGQVAATGCGFLNETYPGLTWNSTLGKVVAYPGTGNSIYIVNFNGASTTCTQQTFSGVTGTTPAAQGAGYQGIFKRFQYLPKLDVYALCNNVDANCFALKQ